MLLTRASDLRKVRHKSVIKDNRIKQGENKPYRFFLNQNFYSYPARFTVQCIWHISLPRTSDISI